MKRIYLILFSFAFVLLPLMSGCAPLPEEGRDEPAADPPAAVPEEKQEKTAVDLSGKKLIVLGDSITAGVGADEGGEWWRTTAASLGCADVSADGLAGGCISSTAYFAPGSERPSYAERAALLPADGDVYLIFGGTNDYAHASVPGTPDDTQDTSFCGALSVIAACIREKAPAARIVFITPTHRYGNTFRRDGSRMVRDSEKNDVGAALSDYRDAMIATAERLGVPFIDAYAFSEFDSSAGQNGSGAFDPNAPGACPYSADGLHPNAAGHVLLGEKIAEEIKTVFAPAGR